MTTTTNNTNDIVDRHKTNKDMTAPTKPSSFAKNMESNPKRLTQQKHVLQRGSLPYRKIRLALSSATQLQCVQDEIATNSSLSERLVSSRLCEGMPYEKANNNEQVNRRHRWRSPIGTIADHRMTNNNRIRKQWHIFSVILLPLILCIVQLTVVNGHPDPAPTPIRVSHSYTKTVSNTIPTSTTSRSTTQITSFLPSDAISSLSSSVINYKNYNTFAGNRSTSSITTGGGIGSSFYNSFKNVTSAVSSSNANIHHNANIQPSSRRSSSSPSAHASRKDFSFSPMTSIDRPFYTKISSTDAIAPPSHYKRTKAKKGKKGKNSSRPSSSFSKYSKTKGSKEQYSSSSTSAEDMDNDVVYGFMPQTTEKSYHHHPPKLSLEPFFNFLTSLATASREVIMSKEQHHQNNNNNNNNNQHQTEQSSSTTGDSSKYSPSYETINQSIREGAKKSKKSKKGGSKSKKKGKGHGKGSKKGKGGGKRHRIKSIESLSLEDEEDEIELDQADVGPVPIQLPNPIIDSPEDAKEEDDGPSDDGMESSGGLHILDVLRTPMIPDYESPPPPARAEPLVAMSEDYHHDSSSGGSSSSSGTSGSNNAYKNLPSNTSSSSSSSALPVNPPSGRANINKGQGYLKFDKYEGPATQNMSGSMMQKQQREKQRSERDPMDSYNDQHGGGGVDLQAQESISHAQVVPSPFGMNNDDNGGLVATSYQFQQQHFSQQPQHPKSNNELSLASSPQQVSLSQNNSPEFVTTGKNAGAVASSESNVFGQSHPNGKNDFVSKYPTTFVYQSNSQAGGQPPPGPRPYMNPSPPSSYPNNNGVVYGSPASPPPSSRPPFRMNKLRPNLHSYYDSSYHNYAGVGESPVASEMIGIRHPYGPPHFKPSPPRVMHHNSPFPLPSPPRFVNGYGNRPGFMMMPHRGTHYVGHTLNQAPSPNPNTKPFDDHNTDYPQDLTGGNGNIDNNENSSVGNQDISGSDVTGGASDNPDQYTLSDIDDNSVTAAENSETKKVGIMESFDVFYKEYKILTWVAVFFVTSMALLTLLVYLYINNPPTEVVQARQLFPWNDLFKNPQITRFLSSLTDSSSSGNSKRKRDGSVGSSTADDDDEYIKPYGHGFGGKSGKQKRKQTRIQQDNVKFVRRINKIKRQKENKQSSANSSSSSSGSGVVSPSSGVNKITTTGRNVTTNSNKSISTSTIVRS